MTPISQTDSDLVDVEGGSAFLCAYYTASYAFYSAIMDWSSAGRAADNMMEACGYS